MSKLVRAGLIGIVAVVLVVGLALLLAQDQETLTIRSAVSAEDPRHPAYLAALVGADLRGASRYVVHTNGQQFFPAMLTAIRTASRRISFESYIYNSTSTIGAEFSQAFADAARRGVTVQLLLDAAGSSTASEEDLARLRAAGCTVALFNTPRWYALEELNYRTHRKVLVVDSGIAFTGGAGVDDKWQGDARTPSEWRDTQIEVHGPLARLVEGGFYENFIEAGGIVTPLLDDPIAGAGDGMSFVVRSSSSGGSNDLKRLYLLAIASATRTLDITTPYFVPDESTLWALTDAVQRGVRVRLLAEGDVTDAMPVKHASRHFYDRLMSAGVEVYEYAPTMLHAKTLVVDGIWSMFGSANFDNRSLELNDELNVAVSNRELATRLLADLDVDLGRARRLELSTWRQRSWWMRAREQFWSAFGEIF